MIVTGSINLFLSVDVSKNRNVAFYYKVMKLSYYEIR